MFRLPLPLLLLTAVSCAPQDKAIAVHNTPPQVRFLEPVEGSAFEEREAIEFVAEVSDKESSPDLLELEWTSDLDGLLEDDAPVSSSGEATLATAGLSEGLHTITLKATDPSGEIGSDYMTVFIESDCLAQSDCDFDEDGYTEEDGDCDDNDDDRNPGQVDIYNGVDDNCDGVIDEGTDGYDDDGDGHTEIDGDCDDEDDTISPTAEEVEDGIDNNCDDVIDEGTDAYDDDGDGFTEYDGDCDDTDFDVYPGAPEVLNGIDDDCDGFADEGSDTYDDDLDGYAEADGDCDDEDPLIHPGAEEICDEVDNDCDGQTDGDDPDTDMDGDSFSYCDDDCDDEDEDIHPDAEELCDEIDNDCDGDIDSEDRSTDADRDGWSTCDGDCDDSDSRVNPGEIERCDALDVDEDCDGTAEEAGAFGESTFYLDEDGDGYGDAPVEMCDACADCVTNNDDCDDDDSEIHPDGIEVCDGVDNDCDTVIDESGAVGELTWYRDGDGDGYGSTVHVSCEAPVGYVSTSGDCDDSRADISPGATEVCDASNDDEDCDGVSEESGATGERYWYDDGDGDGFGDDGDRVYQCDAPLGHVDNDLDCDDTSYLVNPEADEVCDGVDHDCDGDDYAIEATGCLEYHMDADGDGAGHISDILCLCEDDEERREPGYNVPTAEVDSETDDCCDTDDDSYPGADSATYRNACGSWDRDCDDEVEKKWTANGECDIWGCYPDPSGWYTSSDPACGVAEWWLDDCNLDGWACTPEYESRVQECK